MDNINCFPKSQGALSCLGGNIKLAWLSPVPYCWTYGFESIDDTKNLEKMNSHIKIRVLTCYVIRNASHM